MKELETPKFCGPHRRWGSRSSELSPLYATLATIAVILVGLLAIALLVTVLIMKPTR